MQQLKGYKIESLPISELEKVSDLIFFDGPILSHFIDSKKNNYLFLWTDNDDKTNRWLVWKVQPTSFRQYLTKSLSLKSLLVEKNKDFVYSIDIDSSLNYRNILAIEIDELPNEYVPEEESFYMLNLNPVYEEFFSKNEVPSKYIEAMRVNGIYFKLKPKLQIYSTSISIIDAADFLYNLKTSYLNFIEYDFFNSFKNKFTDVKKLNKIRNKIKDSLIPRLVDVKYSSFEVAINSDTAHHVDENSDRQITEWQSSIIEKYKIDVIDVNYNDVAEVEEILKKYPNEVRKGIFQPIIEISQNSNYSTQITFPSTRMVKNLLPVNKENKEKIIPLTETVELAEPNKKLINFVLEVTDLDNIKNIGKKELQSGLLFSQEIDNLDTSFNIIKTKNRTYNLKQEIKCNLNLTGNIYTLECSGLAISATSPRKDEVYTNFYKKLDQLYLDIESKKGMPKEIIEYFNSHIDSVILNKE